MYLDGKEITGVYLGDQEISNAYVGDKEVFSSNKEPLYAAYHTAGYSAEYGWLYAKYPLDGSLLVYYYSGNYENKVSSSSQLTATFPVLSITEELVTPFNPLPTANRDRSADLYT